MKRFLMFCLCCFVIMSVGCAKMPSRYDYVKMDLAPVKEADATSGLVVFLRENAFVGGGVSYFIQEDTKTIGLLRSGSYFIHKAPIGKYTYIAETEAKTVLVLDIKPYETRYVLGGISVGALTGRATLEEITEGLAKQLLPELEYIRLATPEEIAIVKEKKLRNKQQSLGRL